MPSGWRRVRRRPSSPGPMGYWHSVARCRCAAPAARNRCPPVGQPLYSRRIATVEPVFANIRHHKGMRRFTLRGKAKVGVQWQLYCLVHNIEKIAHRGGEG